MILLLLGLLGLTLGSFVNAFVWRLHEQETLREQKRKPSKRRLAELSIVHGRSMCPNCRHELAAQDLVPVFSWLWLRGRCRYCQTPISGQYPLVELLTAGLFMLSYLCWPLNLSGAGLVAFGFWLVFVVAFMALTVYDLRWFLLPHRVVFPLMALALIQVIVVAAINRDGGQVLWPLLGAVIISGLFYIMFQVSAGTWIGGGDVKLAVILGLLAGTPAKALLLLFLASAIGTVVSLPLAARAKNGLKLRVPFGPFLLAGTLVTVLFGSRILDWYTHSFL